jgi:hypothetical protein
MSHDQRKRTYIDGKVQGALARRMIWHWCLFLLAASGAAFLLEVFLNPFEPFNVKMVRIWKTHGPFLLTALFLVPVFVRDAVALSHRFVGPVTRLRTSLRSLANGTEATAPMKLRPDDFWHDMAEEFNEVRERMAQLEQATTTPRDEEAELAIH